MWPTAVPPMPVPMSGLTSAAGSGVAELPARTRGGRALAWVVLPEQAASETIATTMVGAITFRPAVTGTACPMRAGPRRGARVGSVHQCASADQAASDTSEIESMP